MQAPRGSALVILAALGMGFSRPAATLGQQVAQAERLRYAVQIAAFADADRADAARMQWATPERPIYVTPVEVDGRIFHRVLAGLFSEREEAEALMSQATGDKPEDASVHFNHAVFLVNSGKVVEAIAEFEAALLIDPTMAEAHFHAGTLLVGEGKTPEAIEHLEKYLSMNPQDEQNAATAKALIESLKK